MKTSRIQGFYKLSVEERLKIVKEFANLSDEEVDILYKKGISVEQANHMIENVIGIIGIPLGIATNFLINGKDYLIPMAIEEPSVVAAASNAARMAREKGGFKASSTDSVMIGQIQITDLKDIKKAEKDIISQKNKILEVANSKDPVLVKFGGGATDIRIRVIKAKKEEMLIVHLLVDVRDAMGANAVNTMSEAVAPILEEISKGKVYLRIISNLSTERLARAEAIFSKEALGGTEIVDGIIKAYEFADLDQYRACTHNKGIMNGITAVGLATGNDTRAIEAGAHSYAAISGKYRSLTKWEKTKDNDLKGSIEIPIAVGIIGGATKIHPVAKIALKILNVNSAKELSEIMAAVGLAQNLAAMRALVAEGIQRGHMRLHARNIAVTAGAVGDQIEKVAEMMANENNIRLERAKEIINELNEVK